MRRVIVLKEVTGTIQLVSRLPTLACNNQRPEKIRHELTTPVVRLLDVLTFRGHCCLVMEHLDGTLHPYTMPAAGRRPANGAAPSKRGPGDGDLSAPRSREQVRRDDRSLPAVRPQARGGIGGSGVDCVAGSEVGCPTHVIRHVALQLVGALLLLHDHGLIHADIKPQSVLVGIEGEAVRGGHAAAPPRLEDFMRGRAGEGFMGTGCSPGRLMLKLWDFGTTIHRSEACQYYNDFDIQTLAFRAPEASFTSDDGGVERFAKAVGGTGKRAPASTFVFYILYDAVEYQ